MQNIIINNANYTVFTPAQFIELNQQTKNQLTVLEKEKTLRRRLIEDHQQKLSETRR